MKNYGNILIVTLLSVFLFISCGKNGKENNAQFVNKFIGSGGEGRVTPVASVPFGMMQIGADTRPYGSGYNYGDENILGFSHVHKSGGGCADFLDILFMPLEINKNTDSIKTLYSTYYFSKFSHQNEKAAPGYYAVQLYENNLNVELTASKHCGVQRYTYPHAGKIPVIIDLEYGSPSACTIQEEHDVDTVVNSFFEKVDDYTVRGFRISNGWTPEQHVYFFTKFTSPIRECILYVDNERVDGVISAEGRNVKVLLIFDDNTNTLEIKTAISAVDLEGAEKNLLAETADLSFDKVHENALSQWNDVLSKVEIETANVRNKEIFYSSLHNVMMYPMLFSDTDNRFRGPDNQIHSTDGYPYYGMVVGLWDTFRAAVPLTSVLFPDVMNDYVKTALEHYKYAGQLPIWTLWGKENYQMIGIHSLPMITNAYLNGITGFDTKLALDAMEKSAMKDTVGYSMGYFVGMMNYRKYGYVPADLEMEATARTLEYAFDDYALAKFAEKIGNDAVSKKFYNYSKNYNNVIDSKTLFARGRMTDGTWRTPFNPLQSEHRRDDYCEGNAWQWTFFVPHDVEGLAEHLGGNEALISRLDSLFSMGSQIHGKKVSGDISGFIGQYAHGNEPGHHTIYMYNKLGQPKKTQKYINRALTSLYDNSPHGYSGNEDTGQMSAWYVFSSLGFYPMNPVSGQYELGAPLFEKATLNLPNGKKFIIQANNLSDENIFVTSVSLNGKKLDRTYITFDEVLNGGKLVFEMSGE